jgi:hypothetical protein
MSQVDRDHHEIALLPARQGDAPPNTFNDPEGTASAAGVDR